MRRKKGEFYSERKAKRSYRKRRAGKTYTAIAMMLTNQWFLAGLAGAYDSRTWGKTRNEARKNLGWK